MSTFRLTNDRLLEVQLQNTSVSSKAGAMVACEGDVRFTKLILGGEGLLGSFMRRAVGGVTGEEQLNLMQSQGTGRVWFADQAREVSIIPLRNERLFVESASLLALESGLKTGTHLIAANSGVQGAVAGAFATGQGIFTTSVEGTGSAAIVSHGSLLQLEVDGSAPLFVDPDAFIGYKGNLRQEFHFDVNWRVLLGQRNGESYQLKFTGQGTVYVQPSERR